MWYNKEMHIDIAHLIIVLVVILISMTLHEAMHGFVAYWLGDDTAKEQGRSIKDMTLGEMDTLWEEAKALEPKA